MSGGRFRTWTPGFNPFDPEAWEADDDVDHERDRDLARFERDLHEIVRERAHERVHGEIEREEASR